MALSTVRIANGKVANEDMVAVLRKLFHTTHTSIDTDLTIPTTQNFGAFGPITLNDYD